ncbi:histidine kinase dimerization/phospho-acceptor domain-containing protein [uncultured Roseovarius sp.]|uniref:sensor histidine kinase n=1 Tax=uncultured Roseovarius sp. TaxID=293344 RepID=UPI0025EC278A|nr:histidine kinase dimerization/phospho-acceptor domain-containing protein [uncultured Roseovarius sp.]
MSRDISLSKVFIVLVTLVGAELCIMLGLAKLEERMPWLTQAIWGEAILDSALLFCIMAPVFYWLLIRPLQRSNTIKLRFLDMVSDDLRNPLNALQGIAMASREDPSLAAGLEKARQEALQWMQLRVERVVAFSALEAEASLPTGLPTNLQGLATELQKRFEFMFTNTGNTLDIHCEGPNLPIGPAQSEMLIQLMFSMLEIARMSAGDAATNITIRASDEDAGKIHISAVHEGKTAPCNTSTGAILGPFERIKLARDILEHMASRAGCDYQAQSDCSQSLLMRIKPSDP